MIGTDRQHLAMEIILFAAPENKSIPNASLCLKAGHFDLATRNTCHPPHGGSKASIGQFLTERLDRFHHLRVLQHSSENNF